MVQIDIDMPDKCSECPIETREVLHYGYDTEIHYYCPVVSKNKYDWIYNKTDDIRKLGRHERCPLHENN